MHRYHCHCTVIFLTSAFLPLTAMEQARQELIASAHIEKQATKKGALHRRIRKGTINTSEQFTREQVIEHDKYKRTPLHIAAAKGNVAVVNALLAAGSSINAVDDVGWTPLHMAILHDHNEVAEILINRGSNPNVTDLDGMTPLHWACRNNLFRTVSLLLVAGSSINAPDKTGMTPIHWAAKEGHDTLVDLLLSKNAKASLADNDGLTPLHHAVIYEHMNVVQVIINNGYCPWPKKSWWNPFSTPASYAAAPEIAEYLTKNAPAIHNLWQAAFNNDLDLACKAVENGAPVDVQNSMGSTPLMIAACKKSFPLISILAAAGAQICKKNNVGECALSIAKKSGNAQCYKLCNAIANGLDFKSKNARQFMTTLYIKDLSSLNGAHFPDCRRAFDHK